MSLDRSDVAAQIFRRLNILIITTVILFVALLGMGVYVYSVTRNNTRALCAIKLDATRRVSETQEFLKEHPEGIPGLEPEILKRGIDTAKAQVKALSDVSCPPPTIVPRETK